MIQLVKLEELTVLKNITQEAFYAEMRAIECIVNEMAYEILVEHGMIDIGDMTLIRVIRCNDDLIVSIDDMYYGKYYKEQRLEAWF